MGHRSKCKTMKFLEENRGENLHDLGLSKDFLDRTPKAQSISENFNKLGFIKIKIFAL